MDHSAGDGAGYVLGKEQKIGVILLLIFGFLSLGLGALQIRNTLYAPFSLNKKIPPSLKDQVATPDALRWRDTDRDLITDFDEQYVYNTSAYLSDTDSDGIKDSDEIKRGTDPLCAEGKNCREAIAAGATTAAPASATGTIIGFQNPEEEVGPPPVDLDRALADPNEIRNLLLGVGMDKEVLKQVTDEELLFLVKEVINVSNTPFGFPLASGTVPATR